MAGAVGNKHRDAVDDGVGARAGLTEKPVGFEAKVAEAGGAG